jgi:alkylation response protein AidB-like acyl-CoA dehydrogenase
MSSNFDDDQNLVKAEVRNLLDGVAPLGSLRRVLDGQEPYNAALWNMLGQNGWLSASVPESLGGLGLSLTASCAIAEEYGRSLAAAPISSSIYLALEAVLQFGSGEQQREIVPALAAGQKIGCFAIAEQIGPLLESGISTTWRDGKLHGRKLAVTDGLVADLAVVVARGESGEIGLFVADLAASGVKRSCTTSFDPTRPQACIEFAGVDAQPLAAAKTNWASVWRLLERAAVLLAFEQVGAADACLHSARDYALQRYAFGRVIGSYQAVKHRLADVYVNNQLARAHAMHAARVLEKGEGNMAAAACAARISATTAFDVAARDSIQTFGGIAATWEHHAHLYYRRARQYAVLLGTPAQWKRQLMNHIDRQVAH